jgi:hypothetical protein
MKVICRQKNIFSLLKPLVRMGTVAFRTTSISARMEENVPITTFFTFVDMVAEFACATFFYIMKCPVMAGQHTVAKAFMISRIVAAEYFT